MTVLSTQNHWILPTFRPWRHLWTTHRNNFLYFSATKIIKLNNYFKNIFRQINANLFMWLESGLIDNDIYWCSETFSTGAKVKFFTRRTMASLLFKTGCCNMSNIMSRPDLAVSSPMTRRRSSEKLENRAARAATRVLFFVGSSRGCWGAAGYLKREN